MTALRFALPIACLLVGGCCTDAPHSHDPPKGNPAAHTLAEAENCQLRIRYWIDGGFAGRVQQAVQVVHKCSADTSYPFAEPNKGVAEIHEASVSAACRILGLLDDEGFWGWQSHQNPGVMDAFSEVIQVKLGDRTHTVVTTELSLQDPSKARRLIQEILEAMKSI